jgi:hypothetical protein
LLVNGQTLNPIVIISFAGTFFVRCAVVLLWNVAPEAASLDTTYQKGKKNES